MRCWMRLHTLTERSVFIWYMNANVLRNFHLKQPSRARIHRFELKIAYFAQEFYEVYIIWVEYMYLTVELNLICWFERHLRMHTKFQLQCEMIYLKNIATTLQNCILYTTLTLAWWWRYQQQHILMSIANRSRLAFMSSTHNQCANTSLECITKS